MFTFQTLGEGADEPDIIAPMQIYSVDRRSDCLVSYSVYTRVDDQIRYLTVRNTTTET